MLIVKRIRDVKLPAKTYETDAGLDFYVPDDFTECSIEPGESLVIPTGVVCLIPKHCVGIILNKSGVAINHGLLVGAQVIDRGYTNEIHMDLHNVSQKAFVVKPGYKLTQMLIMPLCNSELLEVNDLQPYVERLNTQRKENGLGHSTNIEEAV